MIHTALINGQPADSLPVTDRGLHYGDGLFETIAVYNGDLLCWDAHMERLLRGCDRLQLPAPETPVLLREAQQLCGRQQRAVLKLIVTRGESGRGYAPAPAAASTRIGILYPWPAHPPANRREGVQVRLCSTRLGCNPRLAGIKHLNRLEQVLARGEWSDPDIAEGLTCDDQARVIEGTMSNLFVVRGRQLLTPDLSDCGVAGTVRKEILAIAPALGLAADIAEIHLNDLAQADELFLCNSVIGIWPVRRFGERTYPVGTVAQRIGKALIERKTITPD